MWRRKYSIEALHFCEKFLAYFIRLNRAERLELQRLGSEVDQILLANSHALAQALRSELFDERGRPIKSRFRQALDAPTLLACRWIASITI